MSILSLLQGDNIEPRRVTAQEMAGACPVCGGNDRFRVWPEKGRWWCRGCDKSGDEIEYLREYRGLSFVDACKVLNREPSIKYDSRNVFIPPPGLLRKWEPKPEKTPVDTWQEKAGAFVAWAHEQLLINASILQWLEQERGISLETVKARRLGWNGKDVFLERERWGLEPKLNDKGNPSKLFLPAGLVIPTFRGETLLRVRVRRHEPGEGQRYIFVSGGSSGPLILGEDQKTLVIVESELDAILLYQDAGDIAGAVALGSVSIRPDVYTNSILLQAENVLVALDSDEAGAKESWQWWKENYPDSERWPIIDGKDPTEAKKNGLILRDWILAGIPETSPQEPQREETRQPEAKQPTHQKETPSSSSNAEILNRLEVVALRAVQYAGKLKDSSPEQNRIAGLLDQAHEIEILEPLDTVKLAKVIGELMAAVSQKPEGLNAEPAKQLMMKTGT